ncbi:flagellar FlbD family protein [Lederbergia wuyishanensis]|uniref:Flagellar protein FlbD n=1 Tax=Lederbergia wuyishanensis TaxID=1347903 RepID=A0ABU0CZT3_9BACI|nr:flagellar FlbD family protein [Lederbergia wuyishanensis]MCJ8006271.1 flagellar FlbD family protein [Lederbergia wuyishanensis]MDQ0341640.1 flagellar protein FlbD [Lederbergia wuyishanensis]
MIKITRLNGSTFILNALYIEKVESFPDTTITLTNGRKYVAAESEELINNRIVEFYQSINLLGRKELEDLKDE